MSTSRATRSKKTTTTAAPSSHSIPGLHTAPSSRSIRALPRRTAPPTTNKDKDRLVERFLSLYDKGEISKNDVMAARSKAQRSNAGRAFEGSLVSF
jgi:hypothetical protein